MRRSSCLGRYRWTISQDEPPLLGYDQDLWVARLRHNEGAAEELLAVFSALRTANLRSGAGRPPRIVIESGSMLSEGPRAYGLMFRMLAGMIRFHLTRMRETLRAVRQAG